ncbi:LLM class flavin-dependent oxidoreductase [Cellulomonas sp. Marseille-Q8402]
MPASSPSPAGAAVPHEPHDPPHEPPDLGATHVVLGVDLSAVGARPGEHGPLATVAARPFDGERLARLVHRADRGLLDLVVLGDALLLHPGRRQVPGRFDAAVAAARVAPLASQTALVAGVAHREVEPAHLAAAIRGVQRAGALAGWQLAAPAGYRDEADDAAWAADAAAALAAVVAAWDGGQDAGAVRRDGQGRYRVDHEGIRFAVRGRAAAAPAPGAGVRPLVVVPVTGPAGAAVAGRYADVARVAVPDPASGARLRQLVRSAATAAGRRADAVRVLADVDVALADDRASAAARLDLVRAVERPGDAEPGRAGDRALVLAGTGADLAGVAADWVRAGAADGFVVRPSSPEADLDALVDRVVPALQQAGLFRLRPAPPAPPDRPRQSDVRPLHPIEVTR